MQTLSFRSLLATARRRRRRLVGQVGARARRRRLFDAHRRRFGRLGVELTATRRGESRERVVESQRCARPERRAFDFERRNERRAERSRQLLRLRWRIENVGVCEESRPQHFVGARDERFERLDYLRSRQLQRGGGGARCALVVARALAAFGSSGAKLL